MPQAPENPPPGDKPPSRGRSRLRGALWALARVAVLSYLGLIIVLYFLQAKLLYYPQRELEGSPADAGMTFEDVHFHSADGVKLHGWFIPAKDERAVVLFCHGNAGNISHRIDFAKLLHRLGLSVFLFDYRGYGNSEGKPDEEGTYRDAEAAWEHLVQARKIDPSRVIVQGRSLGGSVAAHLATSRRPAGLIVESTFTSMPDLAAKLYPWLPARWMCRFKYETVNDIRRVNCPVLVVHGRNDSLIPFSHGRAVFEAAPRPKRFLELAGDHNDAIWVSGDEYHKALDEFVAECVEVRRAGTTAASVPQSEPDGCEPPARTPPR
jgi:hypothetical protein